MKKRDLLFIVACFSLLPLFGCSSDKEDQKKEEAELIDYSGKYNYTVSINIENDTNQEMNLSIFIGDKCTQTYHISPYKDLSLSNVSALVILEHARFYTRTDPAFASGLIGLKLELNDVVLKTDYIGREKNYFSWTK